LGRADPAAAVGFYAGGEEQGAASPVEKQRGAPQRAGADLSRQLEDPPGVDDAAAQNGDERNRDKMEPLLVVDAQHEAGTRWKA
jgi:hypothetical protein